MIVANLGVTMTTGVFSSTVVLVASGALLVLYLAYRAALPRPIPGIPHNRDAASKLLGDVPEMLAYVRRTKRIFVSLPSKSSDIGQGLTSVVLAHFPNSEASQPHYSSVHQAHVATVGGGDRPL